MMIAMLANLCLELLILASNVGPALFKLENSEARLRNELAKFRIWTSEVDLQAVDQALAFSLELERTVLQRLLDIAQLLLRGIHD